MSSWRRSSTPTPGAESASVAPSMLRVRYARTLEVLQTTLEHNSELKGEVARLRDQTDALAGKTLSADDMERLRLEARAPVEKQLAAVQQTVEDLRAQLRGLEAAKLSKNGQASNQVKRLLVERDALKAELAKLQARVQEGSKRQSDLQDALVRVQALQNENLKLKHQVQQVQTSMTKVLAENEEQTAAFNKALQRAEEQLVGAQSHVNSLGDAIRDRDRELEDMHRLNAELHAQVVALQDQLSGLSKGRTFGEFVGLKQNNVKLQQEVAKLKRRAGKGGGSARFAPTASTTSVVGYSGPGSGAADISPRQTTHRSLGSARGKTPSQRSVAAPQRSSSRPGPTPPLSYPTKASSFRSDATPVLLESPSSAAAAAAAPVVPAPGASGGSQRHGFLLPLAGLDKSLSGRSTDHHHHHHHQHHHHHHQQQHHRGIPRPHPQSSQHTGPRKLWSVRPPQT